MAEDDDDTEDHQRQAPPATSRLDRGGRRPYRVLSRASTRYRNRKRFQRLRKQMRIGELLGSLIEHHGLTDEVRKRCVCIYWPEIVGERMASRTFPVGFRDGVLQVSAISSSWVQELRFLKDGLVTNVNAWVDRNRVWLGPPPLVLDMRFVLTMKHRDPLVERDHVHHLRRYHACRTRPRAEVAPPSASDAERASIRVETAVIVDPELRALIEGVRVKWNR